MPPGTDPDLHWTAFLYASGDLPPGDEAAFERRLAEDQSAREAVAEAVELAGALATLGPVAWSAPRPRRLAPRILAWSALAAAACLIAATLGALRSARTATPDASEVAMAWSGLRGLEAIGGEVDALDLGDASHAVEPHLAVVPDAPALPSWLLTAASGPVEESPQEEN